MSCDLPENLANWPKILPKFPGDFRNLLKKILKLPKKSLDWSKNFRELPEKYLKLPEKGKQMTQKSRKIVRNISEFTQ